MEQRVGAAALIVASLLGLWGCEPDRAPALQAELADLKKARIEKDMVTRAKEEADKAEADVAQARAKATEDTGASERAASEADARATKVRNSLDGEAKRNEALRGELEELAAKGRELEAKIAELEGKKRRIQRRARYVRDQALTLASSFAEGDPKDIVERRQRSVAEFLDRVRQWFPREQPDPVDVGSDGEAPAEHSREANRQKLFRLADRFSERYALESVDGQQPMVSTPEPQRTE